MMFPGIPTQEQKERIAERVRLMRRGKEEARRYREMVEKGDVLVRALKEIVNPLGVLQKRAEANGDRLSGQAYTICNSLSYVQKIARDALAVVGQGKQPE